MVDDMHNEDVEEVSEVSSDSSSALPRVLLILVIVAFAILIAWKFLFAGEQSVGTSSITAIHNDAIADFESASESGQPTYVLFHSLTCEPCIEISEVADEVIPDYEGEVVFVNVITDDPSGQQLADRFSFQYIPTSFFLGADGTIIDSFTGAIDEADMRARLDALVESQ